MKILFFDYHHIPLPDANGNCVEALRCQLKRRGIDSDILTFGSHDPRTRSMLSDPNGTIYLTSTWAVRRRLRPETGVPLWKWALNLPLAVTARFAHRLLSNRYTLKEKGFSWRACGRSRRRLEELCRKNHYDWVVAVSNPYFIHEIACRANLSGAKLALYYLDPYSSNTLYSDKNRSRRIREECESVSKAAVVFTSIEHINDWVTSELSQYREKLNFLPYPNLFPRETKRENLPFVLEEEKIHLVYLGTLRDKVRYPQVLLKLYEKMLQYEPRLQLYLVGHKSGPTVTQQISEFQTRLGSKLICIDAIPFPQAMELIRQADCAVNLGNYMNNQMPSKLLDYIAAGKPILNISHNRPCNTEPYITRYPWALQFYEEDLQTSVGLCLAAQKAVEFVHANQGRTLPWPAVQSAMQGFTAEDAAGQFLTALEKSTV